MKYKPYNALAMAIASVVAASSVQAGELVAQDMVDSGSQNLIAHTNAFEGAFSSGADGFQKYQRNVSASIPFAVLDDTLSVFTGDTLGIIDEDNVEQFFGVTDTKNGDNSSGDVSAQWQFDISGYDNLSLSIDVGAMGDFETSDRFVWKASIDGGAEQVLLSSEVDESGTQSYVLASGKTVDLNDPMLLNGAVLTNQL